MLGWHLCPSVLESYIDCEGEGYLHMNCETGTENIVRQIASKKCQIPRCLRKCAVNEKLLGRKEKFGPDSRRCSLGDQRQHFKVKATMYGMESSLP